MHVVGDRQAHAWRAVQLSRNTSLPAVPHLTSFVHLEHLSVRSPRMCAATTRCVVPAVPGVVMMFAVQLSDCNVPTVDGLETATKLQTLKVIEAKAATPTTPVIPTSF